MNYLTNHSLIQVPKTLQESSNTQITLLRKLRLRKHREKEHLFIVEGDRAVQQVLENGFLKVISVFYDDTQTHIYANIANSFFVDRKIFTEISDTDTPQGVLAICEIPDPISFDELSNSDGIIVATDAIQDPGNLGTIFRTASWFGCKAILLGKGTVDIFNPKVARSTAGATGMLSYLTTNLEEMLNKLESIGWEVLLLDGNAGAIPINQIQHCNKQVLVVGNEANGFSENLITNNRKRVLIPSKGPNRNVESLNAAVALSIGLWKLSN